MAYIKLCNFLECYTSTSHTGRDWALVLAALLAYSQKQFLDFWFVVFLSLLGSLEWLTFYTYIYIYISPTSLYAYMHRYTHTDFRTQKNACLWIYTKHEPLYKINIQKLVTYSNFYHCEAVVICWALSYMSQMMQIPMLFKSILLIKCSNKLIRGMRILGKRLS